jgi:hypothetical protein
MAIMCVYLPVYEHTHAAILILRNDWYSEWHNMSAIKDIYPVLSFSYLFCLQTERP